MQPAIELTVFPRVSPSESVAVPQVVFPVLLQLTLIIMSSPSGLANLFLVFCKNIVINTLCNTSKFQRQTTVLIIGGDFLHGSSNQARQSRLVFGLGDGGRVEPIVFKMDAKPEVVK